MVTPAKRFQGWIETLSEVWKVRLAGWMVSWLFGGLLNFLEAREPEIIALTEETIGKIKQQPNIPPELLNILNKSTKTGQIGDVIAGYIYTILGSVFAIMSLGAPIGRDWEYAQERAVKSFRLDPETIIRLWLRDKEKYQALWEDLKDQGYDQTRLEGIQELAKIIPPLADMVRFADFGSFDPKIIELWRQFYDAPSWISEPMSLLGITNEEGRDWANKYWFSHWRQPGRFELGEIYRRGLLGPPKIGQEEIGGDGTPGPAEELVKNAYLTQGFSAFWQDHLLQLVREVPTRVDVRRWWDMRTIDEAELREIYQRQGYFGKDLENYVLWTKVYTGFPDLIARWKNGWITQLDVRAELTALGMPEARVEELIQTKIKAEAPERTANERDLTKTDIYKGVKQDRISRDQGVELLQDLGFDEDEAVYLLEINIPPDEEDKVVKERELSKTDIKAGIAKEILTRAEARAKLLDLRYSPADADFLLDIYEVVARPPTEPKLKEASKADILLGVKKGLITPEEGYSMLLDLDFTPEAADFILMVKAEEKPFSPINFAEFKDLTQKWRVASGVEAKPMTEELKKAGEEVVRLTGEVEALNRSVEEEAATLIDEFPKPEAATAKLEDLQVTRNRAISELERVKSEYDKLLAEWRHGKPEIPWTTVQGISTR